MEINKIFNVDAYEAIKDIPDKSIDCIYTDIPYLIDNHGFGKSDLGNRMKNKTSGLLVSSQTAALFEKIMGKQLVRSLTQVRYISYNKAKFKISKGDKLWLS